MESVWSSADFWIATGTIGLFFATLLLAFVGWHQIGQLRRETKKWRTIEACELYDRDPTLHTCLKAVREYKMSKANNIAYTGDIKTEVVSILNYLDGIAIGVDQGLYLDKIVKDHLGSIIASHVADHLTSRDASVFGVKPESFKHLMSLYQRWDKLPPATSFREKP